MPSPSSVPGSSGKRGRCGAQVRVPVPEVAGLIRQLVDEKLTWQDVAAKYPAQKAPADE